MAVMTSRGRITIPAKVRAAPGVGPGDKVEFVKTGLDQFSIVPAAKPTKKLRTPPRNPAKRLG
jgi:antitoxin PrlF